MENNEAMYQLRKQTNMDTQLRKFKYLQIAYQNLEIKKRDQPFELISFDGAGNGASVRSRTTLSLGSVG